VDVRIVLWERDDVLTLPLTALFRHGEEWAVFAAVDGRARLRIITLGRRNDLEAEIVEGLEEGDQVVLHPSDRVVDGVRIAARE
jgi:HlyD family secretion protein